MNVDVDSLFGSHVNLSPEVHNGLVLFLFLIFSVWYAETLRRLAGLRSVYRTLMEREHCLHLPGMAAYVDEFKLLGGLHIMQVLRLKCITPLVIVPRLIIPASIERSSIKLISPTNEAQPETVHIEDDRPVLEFEYCSTSTTAADLYILPTFRSSDLHLYDRRHVAQREETKPRSALPFPHSSSPSSQPPTHPARLRGLLFSGKATAPSQSDEPFESISTAHALRHLTPLLSDMPSTSPALDIKKPNPLVPNGETVLSLPVPLLCSHVMAPAYELPPTHFWTFRHRIPLSSDLCFRKASEFRLSLVLFMHNNLSHVDSSTALPEGLLQDLPQLMRQPYLMNIPVGKAFAQVTQLKIVPSSAPGKAWSVTPLCQIHFGSLMVNNPAALNPRIYYSIFNETAATELLSGRRPSAQICTVATDPLDASAEERESSRQRPFVNRERSSRIFRRLDGVVSSVGRFVRRTGGTLFALPPRHQRLARRLHSDEARQPGVIAPTPKQWKEVMEAQEDVQIFGFRQEDERDCVICMSAPKEVTFLPCRHSSCCAWCLRFLRQGKCPLCRQVFSAYIVLPLHRSAAESPT